MVLVTIEAPEVLGRGQVISQHIDCSSYERGSILSGNPNGHGSYMPIR